MRTLNVHFVAMATKPQLAHLKRCLLTRTKNTSKLAAKFQNTSTVSRKGNTIYLVKLVIPLIFTDI